MSFLKKIRDNLQTIDIFGQQITLCFRKKANYKTSLGGFLSICIIGTIVSFFYANIIDFFAMNQVTTQQETTFNDDAGPVVLAPEDFMFAVQIEQPNFTTQPLFNITLEQRWYTRDANGTQVRQPSVYIDLVPCTISHFKPIFEKFNASFEDEFQTYTLDNCLCPDQSHPYSKNLTVSGGYTSTDYYFLKFSVISCQNSTGYKRAWDPQCQTPDWSSSQRFKVLTTNFQINPNLPHNYIKPYIAIDQFYQFAPTKMLVLSDIYFRPKTITTDKGILMYPNKETITYVQRDYRDSREQYQLGELSMTQFGYFYFVRSPFSYNITRNYLRLDGLLSYLGGFTQFMIVVVGLLVKLYNREHMIVEMANELYQFELNKQKKQSPTEKLDNVQIQGIKEREQTKKTLRKNKVETEIDIKNSAVLKTQGVQENYKLKDSQLVSQKVSVIILQNVQRVKSTLYQQFKKLVDDQYYIGISMRLILSQVLPFSFLQNERCLFIQKTIEEVNSEIDIKNIIKQLHEMTKLKKVLFNQDQLVLFNFTQRPKVNIQKQIVSRLSNVFYQKESQLKEDDLFKTFKELATSYSKILWLDERTLTEQQIQFNQRLISLLGSQLTQMLEQLIAEQQDLEIVESQGKENKSDDEGINSENIENQVKQEIQEISNAIQQQQRNDFIQLQLSLVFLTYFQQNIMQNQFVFIKQYNVIILFFFAVSNYLKYQKTIFALLKQCSHKQSTFFLTCKRKESHNMVNRNFSNHFIKN